MASSIFGNLVKAVVDLERRVMVVDAELHADEEAFLLEQGSEQSNLWGINLYPDVEGEDWLEFDSMINVRPADDNRSRGVENPELQQRIGRLIAELIR